MSVLPRTFLCGWMDLPRRIRLGASGAADSREGWQQQIVMTPTRTISRSTIVLSLASLAGLSLMMLGCSLFGPSDLGTYSLSRINGQALPAPVVDLALVGGGRFQTMVFRGTMNLFDNGTFERVLVAHHVWNGVLEDTTRVVELSGRFERTDTTMVLRFTDIWGPHAWTYRSSDSGRVFRGVEEYSKLSLVVYEFVRQ